MNCPENQKKCNPSHPGVGGFRGQNVNTSGKFYENRYIFFIKSERW